MPNSSFVVPNPSSGRIAIPPFALSWDYRCPFANVLHDHLVTGLRAGAPWQVRFLAFSLDQAHVEAGDPDVWDQPKYQGGLVAMRAAVAVRDTWPERFLDVHAAMFAARHGQGPSITDNAGVQEILLSAGLSTDQAGEAQRRGASADTLAVIRAEHNETATRHDAFGTPTFLVDVEGPGSPVTRATFVRFMQRAGGDEVVAVRTIERLVDMIATWGDLNEFKHTTVSR